MLFLFLAAQAATVPATPSAPTIKPKRVCETILLTGSRSKRRVCRDSSGQLDLAGTGVKDAAVSGVVGNKGPVSSQGITSPK